jgi:hypothetical protein
VLVRLARSHDEEAIWRIMEPIIRAKCQERTRARSARATSIWPFAIIGERSVDQDRVTDRLGCSVRAVR